MVLSLVCSVFIKEFEHAMSKIYRNKLLFPILIDDAKNLAERFTGSLFHRREFWFFLIIVC